MPSFPLRRALPGSTQRSKSRNCYRYVLIVCAIVVVSIAGPSYFLTTKGDSNFAICKLSRIAALWIRFVVFVRFFFLGIQLGTPSVITLHHR